MKIPTPTYRCALARIQPETTDLEAMKQRGWRDQHIAKDWKPFEDKLNAIQVQ